jgi:hypothetical protein
MRGLALFVVIALGGCVVPPSYVDAEAEVYKTIGLDHKACLEADEAKDPDDKRRDLEIINGWRARLEEAGAEL